MRMRVLFVVRNLQAVEPLGLMYVSAMLRRHGHATRLVSTRGIDLPAQVKAFDPEVIGYSVCTGQHPYYLGLNRQLKRHHRFISLFGGPHPTFFPQLIEEEGVDVICRGEGEHAALDLCNRLERREDIRCIPNLWVKADGTITRNALRPLIGDLDSLPPPDRQARYEADPQAREHPTESFLTSRGCPYACSYCFNPAMRQLYGPGWGKRRIRSPQNVVDEIEQTRAGAALQFVQFRCSMFPCEEEWLAVFSGQYRQRIGLPFYCHVRADQISEEAARLLGETGCRSVNMGIECADEHYRRDVLCRPMSNQTIRDACRRLHERGIAIMADNMVGLPGRTLEDDFATLRFNIECGIDYALAMILQPYPGTGICDWAVEHGCFDGDPARIDFSYYSGSPLRFGSAQEKRQIENLQKLFAVGVEAPWLLPLIRRLVRLRPNIIFSSIFRCWMMWCYHRRLQPYRMPRWQRRETIGAVFGFYPKEAVHEGD
jgi:radical SAM superfamily enzyme YgiQ (UPF0313 family)